MNETNNNQNDHPKEEQESLEEIPSEYREISKEELKQILKEHKKWLDSEMKEGKKADLQNTNLSNRDFKGVKLFLANLQRAKLRGANLKKADLGSAKLQNANLADCNMESAILSESDLQNAYLPLTNLQDSNLNNANLENADFIGCNLSNATIQSANLKNAKLQNATLLNTNLTKSNLMGANLEKAMLKNAILQETNLQRASFNGAKLDNALLKNADLKNANLINANFYMTDCFKADLQDAILTMADLKKANFYKSNMKNTDLEDVKNLSKAYIQYANFNGATGLIGNEFAQADVTGTKLPDDIKEFKALEVVKETSQNARKIFFAILLGCVYSWLTIATTTDVGLLTNTPSSPLPIIQTEIPIAWFYVVAPLVIICLYFYFHLYLDNLWKNLANLPAVFPDGKPLDQIVYPWLLNTIVCRHFVLLKEVNSNELYGLKTKILKILYKLKIIKIISLRPLIFYFKEWIVIFIAWWVVPITMIGFWVRYIPRHEWTGTIFHIGLIVVSVTFAILFYRLCAMTLQGNGKETLQENGKDNLRIVKFWGDRRFYYSVSVVLVAFLFSLLSYGAIEGVKSEKPYSIEIKVLVPWVFKIFHYDVFADFREKTVSERPANFFEISKEDRLEAVQGANLRNRNLQFADLSNSFLFKSDLRSAHLENAILRNTNCQNADFTNANLENANMLFGKFRNAKFVNANLQKVNFGAINALVKVLPIARNKSDIKPIEPILAQKAVSSKEEEKSFLNIVFFDFQNADFSGANLKSADLSLANLEGADLRNAINLKIDQLYMVKTLYKTKLDPELLEQVKECCPHLLEKPKVETDQKNKNE